MAVAAEKDFRIVCLGGSAGSLKAYTDILGGLPADTGMAFVIALHRGVEHASLLSEVMTRVTKMPVLEVKEGMPLVPNHVYLMPPHVEMTVKDNALSLQAPRKPFGWPITISVFLLSLAEVYGERAIAVILSGVDHDGSVALKAIKAAGGITFAQSDATFEDMPKHAVETGYVDFLLKPEEIAAALLALR
jgi:two-component system CheB/CheR fusion protein